MKSLVIAAILGFGIICLIDSCELSSLTELSVANDSRVEVINQAIEEARK